ncbi:hypothetical protein ISCU110981_10060 [Isoptericola cucumis]
MTQIASQTGESDISPRVSRPTSARAALPPSPDEVFDALLWALDHDFTALREHRRLAHLGPASRRRADGQLVDRWRAVAATCRGLAG